MLLTDTEYELLIWDKGPGIPKHDLQNVFERMYRSEQSRDSSYGGSGLVLSDEPTNGLDPIGIKEMRKLIKSLAQERNITILISSHILPEVEQLVNRMGIIHEGRLLEEVSLDTLRKANRKYIEFQVNNDNKAAMLLENQFQISDYEVHDEGNIRIYSLFGQQGRINRTFVLNDIEVAKMMISEDRLEDYFTKLVGGGTIG